MPRAQPQGPATRWTGARDASGSTAHSRGLDIFTGRGQLARRMSGAAPEEDFVRDAGDPLAHLHLQDGDGHADRHRATGEGSIEWNAVFRALADCKGAPHPVLELRRKADIPKAFQTLSALGLGV